MIDEAIARWGILAVIVFSFTNGLFSTPPSEVTIGAAGALASGNSSLLFKMFFSILLANYTGTTILFVACKYKGKEWYDRVKKSRLVKRLKLLDNIIPTSEKLTLFFNNRNWLVFVCRFCPCIRSLISVPAGISKMSMIKYTIYTLLGISVWTSFWLYIGQKMMLSYFEENYVMVSVCVLAIVLVWVLGKVIHKRVKE